MYNEWNRRVVTFCFIIKLLQQYFVLLQVWIYTRRAVLSHICVSEGRENVSGWWISYLDTFILLKLFLTYTTHTNFKFSFRKDNWEKQMEPLRLLHNSIQFSECIFLHYHGNLWRSYYQHMHSISFPYLTALFDLSENWCGWIQFFFSDSPCDFKPDHDLTLYLRW